MLVHKLMEYYYSGKLKEVILSYEGGNDNPDWLEALRLFAAYKDIYPPNEWEVLACEKPLEVKNQEKYGVPELTGRLDMLVRVSPEHVATLKRTRKLDLEPGIYIVDTKVKNQRKESLEWEYAQSIQFTAYQMMCEDEPTIGPVKGMIASVIVRHVNLLPGKSFLSILVRPPVLHHRDFLRATLSKALDARERHGENYANPEQCFTYKPCPHLLTGVCDRI